MNTTELIAGTETQQRLIGDPRMRVQVPTVPDPSSELPVADTKWQPIETAPRDGTSILVFNEQGRCAVVEWRVFPDGTAIWEVCRAIDRILALGATVTHWMPLPEPPPSTDCR